MWKENKSNLRDVLKKKGKNCDTLSLKLAIFVIDGGHHLHRVRWLNSVTFSDLLEQYVWCNLTLQCNCYSCLQWLPWHHPAQRIMRTVNGSKKGSCADNIVCDETCITCTKSGFPAQWPQWIPVYSWTVRWTTKKWRDGVNSHAPNVLVMTLKGLVTHFG